MAFFFNPSENDAYNWNAKEKFHDAQMGNIEAQNDLGVLYQHGDGVPQNLSKAYYWISKAADGGNATAMYNLGQMFYEGIGMNADDAKAFYWWQKSANLGYQRGIYNTAVCFYLGIGTSVNLKQAERLFLPLAQKGNTDAMNYLGLIYSNDTVLFADLYNIEKAREWFNRGIAHGNYMCEENLNRLN